MLQRRLGQELLKAIADTPVLFIQGARQAGKSTLVQSLFASRPRTRSVTLDDVTVLSGVLADPNAWTAGPDDTLVIDEIQRAPKVFMAIKAAVDRDRRPGRFVLTGSANVLLLPHLSESLAGRMEILTLWPLSQGEIDGAREGFIDLVFSKELPPMRAGLERGRRDLIARVIRGGFPEAVARESEDRRGAWFASYLTTILERDVRELANIEGLTAMPRLMSLLAARTASLLNTSEISRSSRIPNVTLSRYLTLLETTFLLQMLAPWSGNFGKRLVKAPKVFVSDTGLACHLQGLSQARLEAEPQLLGPLLENFVVTELRKQTGFSRARVGLYHFRTSNGQEVDLVLEDASGRCVGIEVKAAGSVDSRDFNGLRLLANELGDKFIRGITLYTGAEPAAFGERLFAWPIDALWRAA